MATDAEIRAAGLYAVPQQKYLQNPFQLPTNEVVEEETESFGIPNTNAFTNSGNSFNQSGNAFGYGSQIEPGGSYGSYDSINYTGGLPGNVQQYGIGRQFEDPSASPTGETYSYKKEVPSLLRAGAAFVPFGNTLLNFAEKKMNTNRDQPSGNYKVGGLDESMKGYYDNLAGSGMLYDGPGGVKTLTGKNFTGKGYLEGQIDLAKGFGFDTMTEEEIEEQIATMKANPKKQFKYKQMLEASQMYKTKKAQEKNKENMANLKAAKSRRESARQYDPAVHGPTNYGLGSDGNQSYDSGQGFGTNATSGGPVSNKTGRGRTDYMEGGRAGYFFGGRVNYKAGGRTDAGPNRTTASHSTRGQINESGQQVSGGQNTRDNNGGNDSPTFYSPPNKTETLYENTILGNVPAGLTRNMNIGRLSAMLNLNKLKDEELEGKMQFDSSIGPINTTTTYDSVNGPEFNASYNNNNLNANFNTTTGLGVNYSKDIGPGTFTVGGDIDPYGNYNTEAKYGISFANGGLASIL